VLIKDEDCLCLDQRLTRKLQLKVEVNLCVAHDFVHETLQSIQTIILPDGNDDFGSDHDSGDDYLTSGISSFPGEDRCSLLKKRLSLSTGTTISHWHEGTIIMYSRPRLLKPRMINPRDGILALIKQRFVNPAFYSIFSVLTAELLEITHAYSMRREHVFHVGSCCRNGRVSATFGHCTSPNGIQRNRPGLFNENKINNFLRVTCPPK